MTSRSRLPRSSQYAETYGDKVELLSRKNSLQVGINEIEEDTLISPGPCGNQNEDKFSLNPVSSHFPSWLRAFMSRSPLLQASMEPSDSSYAAIPVQRENSSASLQLDWGKLRNRHRSSVQSTISGDIGVHSSEGSNLFEDIAPLSDAGDDDSENPVYVDSENPRPADEDPPDNSPSVLIPTIYVEEA